MSGADHDPPIREQKRALRQALRTRRASFLRSGEADSGPILAATVAALVDGAVAIQPGSRVAVYAPMPGELSPAAIAELAERRGASLYYPRIVGVPADPDSRLAFHRVTDPAELRPDVAGILAPAATAPLADRIDIFVVPALAFDGRGYRLGSGRAYYDAALAACPTALRVGVGYDWQLLGHVPTEPHDQPVDLVVTPAGCITTAARAAHPLCRIAGPGPVAAAVGSQRPPSSLGKEDPT